MQSIADQATHPEVKQLGASKAIETIADQATRPICDVEAV